MGFRELTFGITSMMLFSCSNLEKKAVISKAIQNVDYYRVEDHKLFSGYANPSWRYEKISYIKSSDIDSYKAEMKISEVEGFCTKDKVTLDIYFHLPLGFIDIHSYATNFEKRLKKIFLIGASPNLVPRFYGGRDHALYRPRVRAFTGARVLNDFKGSMSGGRAVKGSFGEGFFLYDGDFFHYLPRNTMIVNRSSNSWGGDGRLIQVPGKESLYSEVFNSTFRKGMLVTVSSRELAMERGYRVVPLLFSDLARVVRDRAVKPRVVSEKNLANSDDWKGLLILNTSIHKVGMRGANIVKYTASLDVKQVCTSVINRSDLMYKE